MQSDLLHGDFRQRQDALPGVCFGIIEFGTVIGDDRGPTNVDSISTEIKVYRLTGYGYPGYRRLTIFPRAVIR